MRRLASTLAVVLFLAGCDQGTPQIAVVGEPRAAVPLAGASQVVVTLENNGDGDDRVVGAHTDAALAVELHETEITAGRASMRELTDVRLPAGRRVRFQPGGQHMMLLAPDINLSRGDTFTLTIELEHASPLRIEVVVVDLLDLLDDPVDDEAAADAHI